MTFMLLKQEIIEEILAFWFPNDTYNKFWFDQELNFDISIKFKYNDLLNYIYKNIVNNSDIILFMDSNEAVASILVLDQFSRHIERVNNINNQNTNVHEFTEEAIKISKIWIDKKYYLSEPLNIVVFGLMPLRHSNKLHEYTIILDILKEIETERPKDINILFNKFKNQTLKRYELLKN